MDIVLFGLGQTYKENKGRLSENDQVVALLDNNQETWGTKIDGIVVREPAQIQEIRYDKIVLMSVYASEMRQQLLALGCKARDIVHYKEYICGLSAWEMEVKLARKKPSISDKRCLIITTELGYNGGSIVAIYAAQALQLRGYTTVIATPGGNQEFLEEMRKLGISFIIYKNLAYARREELFWVNDFQFVIVNTLQMICCAIELAKIQKVILWLHEFEEIYRQMSYWKDKIQNAIIGKTLSIYGVSQIAKRNFLKNYLVDKVGILPYGIPDGYVSRTFRKNKKLVFAMIGAIYDVKGQDVFIDAIEAMAGRSNQAVFWIIGKNNSKTSYGHLIEKRIEKYANIRMFGELNREQLFRCYDDIDIFVIPSRYETMSLVATEAMMLGKVCIVSDTVGMGDYIQNYVNGLIFKSGSSQGLSREMLWCMEHSDKLQEIGRCARRTYESNFTLDQFGKRLEEEMLR